MTTNKFFVIVEHIASGAGRKLTIEPDGITPLTDAHQVAALVDEMLNPDWEVRYVEHRPA